PRQALGRGTVYRPNVAGAGFLQATAHPGEVMRRVRLQRLQAVARLAFDQRQVEILRPSQVGKRASDRIARSRRLRVEHTRVLLFCDSKYLVVGPLVVTV